MNSTHILVRWDPPHEDRHHGVIREYHINVTGLDDTILLQLTTDANVTHITVGSLHPFYRYTANVAAVTIGEGSSISVTVRTEEDGESHKNNYRIARKFHRVNFLQFRRFVSTRKNFNLRIYITSLIMPIGICENKIAKTFQMSFCENFTPRNFLVVRYSVDIYVSLLTLSCSHT